MERKSSKSVIPLAVCSPAYGSMPASAVLVNTFASAPNPAPAHFYMLSFFRTEELQHPVRRRVQRGGGCDTSLLVSVSQSTRTISKPLTAPTSSRTVLIDAQLEPPQKRTTYPKQLQILFEYGLDTRINLLHAATQCTFWPGSDSSESKVMSRTIEHWHVLTSTSHNTILSIVACHKFPAEPAKTIYIFPGQNEKKKVCQRSP